MPATQHSVPARPALVPKPYHAPKYEKEHVHDVYDRIAPHFSATRHKPWPRVFQFLESLPEDATLADLGCGNGKYLRAAQSLPIVTFGADRCAPLVDIAVAGAPKTDAAVADVLHLPFRDQSFDAALSVALIHHFSTRQRRIRALRETVRILRPHGRVLVYVWALERPDLSQEGAKSSIARRFEKQDMFVPWHMRTRKEGAQNEKILGDWEGVHHRFYHIYKQGELEYELSYIGEVKVLESYYDHQNWCALIEKL